MTNDDTIVVDDVVEEENETWWQKVKKFNPVKMYKEDDTFKKFTNAALLTILGGVVKLWCSNKEYENSVYVVTQDDEVYKLPARSCKTIKHKKSKVIE